MFLTLDYPTSSPFLPSLQVNLFKKELSPTLTKRLGEIILLEEQNILNIPAVQNPNPEWKDWLTQRLYYYNFLNFDYPEVKELKSIISDTYSEYMKAVGLVPPKTYIQCWANVIRNDGKNITPHTHINAHCNAPDDHSYLSGNICIQAEDTRTYYANPFVKEMFIGIQNNAGEMVLFPSYMLHWTDKNLSEKPRLSLAFDLITEEVYNIVDGKNFIEL